MNLHLKHTQKYEYTLFGESNNLTICYVIQIVDPFSKNFTKYVCISFKQMHFEIFLSCGFNQRDDHSSVF